MEVLRKEVLVIRGRLRCQEPQVIVPEEVRVPEAHLDIEVRVPGPPEVRVIIEVQDLEVLVAIEVPVAIEAPVDLQDHPGA
jgi:hypothetical protein